MESMENEVIKIPRGVVIFREGEEGNFMYLILKGKVRILRKGEEIAVLGKGDFFGDLGLLTGLPRVADAISEEDCELVLIDENSFDKIIKSDPNLSIRILRKLAHRLRDMYKLMDRMEREETAIEVENEPLPSNVKAWFELEKEGEIFPVEQKITFLGRKDLSSSFVPHVDLSPYDKNRYISRRHARVIFRNGKFYIKEEVGVLNGTFLNNRRIKPGFLYDLEDGTRVTLGRLTLVFHTKTKQD